MIKKLTQLFDENLSWVFYLFFALFAIVGVLRVEGAQFLHFDIIEHLHAAWLISEGQVPFRDFFEHHNPLLWYILAPLTQLFKHDVTIIPVVRSIALIGYLLCFILIYQISARYVYCKKAAQTAILLLMSVYFLWRDIANIRPDIFMYLFFFLALYCFFAYLENKKFRYLAISYICCSISFLFLQKTLFLGLGFAIANIWLLVKKEIKISDFIYAAILALFPLLLFAGYLLYTNSFADWFYYNFIFNINLQEYYGDYGTSGVSKLKWITLFSLFIIIRYYKFSTNSFVVLLCCLSTALSFASFAPHPQYYQGYFFLAAILLGQIISNNKFSGLIYVILISLIIISFSHLIPNKGEFQSRAKYLAKTEFIINNASPDDVVLDLDSQGCNVFNKDMDYYWFGFHNVSIIDSLYNPKRYLDLTAQIQNQKPKFICVSNHFSGGINDRILEYRFKWFNMRANKMLAKAAKNKELLDKLLYLDDDFWQIDEQWLKKHYIKHNDVNIYERIN